MTSATVLDRPKLEAFWEAMQAAGASVALKRSPGASSEAIDDALRPLRMQAPPELRTLWSFALPPVRAVDPVDWQVHPGFELVSPHYAIKPTERLLELWPVPRSWVVFAKSDNPGVLVVDCAHQGATSPVIYAGEDDPVQVAQSIGELILHWTEQIRTGESVFEDGWWASEDARLPWRIETTSPR